MSPIIHFFYLSSSFSFHLTLATAAETKPNIKNATIIIFIIIEGFMFISLTSLTSKMSQLASYTSRANLGFELVIVTSRVELAC